MIKYTIVIEFLSFIYTYLDCVTFELLNLLYMNLLYEKVFGRWLQMIKEFDGGIYWLLDCRFDFLLPSFIQEYGVEEKDITFLQSYHGKMRQKWKTVHLLPDKRQSVYLMEPDDVNHMFSKYLNLDRRNLVISLSGAGLPQSDNLETLTAVGLMAELCNDKWWQYNLFQKSHVMTPDTYLCHNFAEVERVFPELTEKYQKIVIKKARLSGGYKMEVLSSAFELEQYCRKLDKGSLEQEFLISEYITHQQSFAGMGVIRKDGEVFFINIVTEQVLFREVAYEGLIFPAFLDADNITEIRELTTVIGKELGQAGYYGFYNVDFVLGDKGLYAVEVNARLGFGSILAACIYGSNFWSVLQGRCTDEAVYEGKRLIIGKVKGREGRSYGDLKSFSGILDWFQKEDGYFETFFCGDGEPELFEYGSYIGVFGEFFGMDASRERVLHRFWERCIKYY